MSAKKALKKQAGGKSGKDSAHFPIEALIEDFVENSADGILIAEKKTRKFKYANSSICEMLGYTNEELMNMSVDDIHPKRYQKKAVSEFLAISKETGKFIKNIACMTKDGKVIYTDIHGTAKNIGKTTYVFGLFRDVSDRKHLEEKLQRTRDEAEQKIAIRESEMEEKNRRLIMDMTQRKRSGKPMRWNEEKYRILIETMNDGLCMVDEDRSIIFINDKFSRMLGYSNNELTGSLLDRFVTKNNRAILEERHALRMEGDQEPYELTFRRKDGEDVIALISPKPVFDEKETFKGAFAVVTDITELKKKEKALAEREEELKIKTKNLEELNNALKVLLERRDEDRVEMEEKVVLNVRRLILPYFDKLKESGINQRQQAFVQILEESLSDIISPFSRTLSTKFVNFTGSEIKIASLIRQGKRTKDIAKLLGISKRTVEAHRDHIRSKLGLKTIKGNLRTHLLSI